MKAVKAWALDSGWGDGTIEFEQPGNRPILHMTRGEAWHRRYNNGRKQKIVRVEIREVKPRRKHEH